MDRETHKRYLEYRELHSYFARKEVALLSAAQFAEADAAYAALEAKGDRRDDDEEARFAELTKLLFRD